MKSIKFIFTALLISSSLLGQKGTIKKADDAFARSSYPEAIKLYEQIAKKGNAPDNVVANLADAYYYTGNMVLANTWYTSLFGKGGANTTSETIFRYAKSAQAIGNNNLFVEQMKKFAELEPADARSVKFLSRERYAAEIQRNNAAYRVGTLGFNSAVSDFGAIQTQRGFYFVSNRSKKKRDAWSGQPLTDLFVMDSPGGAPKSVFKNTGLHDGNVALSANGTTMYITRTNSNLKGKKLKEVGKLTLKIYRLEWTGSGWTDGIDLPINGEDFNTAHPYVSPDGKYLYFASDRSGGQGGMDIYRSELQNGMPGTPENLGSLVNTKGNETFPAVDSKDWLYFSSDGHHGLGGLDLFAYPLGTKYEPQNLGAPINSSFDDFSISFKDDKSGYFSSNRPGGRGMDDVYSFDVVKLLEFSETGVEPAVNKPQIISGFIQSPEGNGGVANATVNVYDRNGVLRYSVKTDNDGKYMFENTSGETDFSIQVDHPGFSLPGGGMSRVTVSAGQSNVVLNPFTTSEKFNEIVRDPSLSKYLQFNHILFASNSDAISSTSLAELRKIADYLRSNPQVTLDIRSHTDHEGNDDANFKLSSDRAASTKRKLVELGVDANRLTTTGYGETQPISCCANIGENRRSEFIITTGTENMFNNGSYTVRANRINFHVIVGGFKTELNAVKETVRLRNLGYDAIKLPRSDTGIYRVSIFSSVDEREAERKLPGYRAEFKGAWIYRTTRNLIY
jgi:outer membrane protein OmpA-like peptidoglycan-associated protein